MEENEHLDIGKQASLVIASDKDGISCILHNKDNMHLGNIIKGIMWFSVNIASEIGSINGVSVREVLTDIMNEAIEEYEDITDTNMLAS